MLTKFVIKQTTVGGVVVVDPNFSRSLKKYIFPEQTDQCCAPSASPRSFPISIGNSTSLKALLSGKAQ